MHQASLSSQEHSPLLHSHHRPQPSRWRWIVLAAFSLFSFCNALMWDTFAPCLYIFVDYYFHETTTATTNAIHTLSAVYMLLYPCISQAAFPFFRDSKHQQPGSGLRRGLTIGAILNLAAGIIRWLGATPSPWGFTIVLVGQTIAAVAQVFLLPVPARLAASWFPDNEINVATAIACASNNLGVAVGCLWTPLAINAETQESDIPRLLLMQLGLCILSLLSIWCAFKRPATYASGTSADEANISFIAQTKQLVRQKSYLCMLVPFGTVMGAQCAIITLLAQILQPAFHGRMDDSFIGWLGCVTLLVGVPASILIGYYLDWTTRYREACFALLITTVLSVLGLYLSTELGVSVGVITSSIVFGISSYGIAPAMFQYAAELYYPVNELISTGHLLSIGNLTGVLYVVLMGWSEDSSEEFPMERPMLWLTVSLFVSVIFMIPVKGPFKRTLARVDDY